MVGGRAGTDYHRSYTSNYTLGNTDVCISNMKPIFLDVIQAVLGVDPRGGYPVPIQLYRLERIPRGKLRRQVVPSCDLCKAKYSS
jgi:hypothetical protein